jgi:hypothetical protein
MEFKKSAYSSSPPDKLVFAADNNPCWMIILPPGWGIEEPPPDFSSEEKDVDIVGKKWETLVWKIKDEVILYNFYECCLTL